MGVYIFLSFILNLDDLDWSFVTIHVSFFNLDRVHLSYGHEGHVRALNTTDLDAPPPPTWSGRSTDRGRGHQYTLPTRARHQRIVRRVALPIFYHPSTSCTPSTCPSDSCSCSQTRSPRDPAGSLQKPCVQGPSASWRPPRRGRRR